MLARFCLAVVALMLPVSVLANDTMAELKTGGLTFVRTGDVTMEKEQLFISQEKITVDYVFKNTTDKDVEGLVAFPMPDISGGPESNVAINDLNVANFLEFSVTQDGKPIETTLQQRVTAASIDVTDELVAKGIPLLPFAESTTKALAALPADVVNDWVNRGIVQSDSYDAGDGEGLQTSFTPLWTLKSVYWWKTTFLANKEVDVSHRYKPSVGGTVGVGFVPDDTDYGKARFREYQNRYCIDDAILKVAEKSVKDMNEGRPFLTEAWISYILMTGNNWGGPIKSFKLTVDKGSVKNFVSFCGTNVKKTGPTTFEMTATDFYPEKDLDILILQAPTGE